MATTKGDIDNSKTAVDDLDKKIKAQVKKVDGATLTTEKDAERKVMGDVKEFALSKWSLKVEGGFFKIQLGASDTVVYGLKAEYTAPLSTAFILGVDTKTVVGVSKSTILGDKVDDIAGAKVDNLMGWKHEVHHSDDKKTGASPMLRKEKICGDKMKKLRMKLATWGIKIANGLYNAEEVISEAGKVKEDIKTLEEKIKTLDESGTTWNANIQKLKQDCSSKASYDTEKLEFTASGWQARGSGSFLNLFPDGSCYVEAGGSGAYCSDDEVRLTGPIHKFGCSF